MIPLHALHAPWYIAGVITQAQGCIDFIEILGGCFTPYISRWLRIVPDVSVLTSHTDIIMKWVRIIIMCNRDK